jgi:hypothetical protein
MNLQKELSQNYCWVPGFVSQNLSHVYFRKELTIDSNIETAEINIYASTLYQIYINGVRIGGGPVRSYPDFPDYDTYDLKEYLKPGKNIIAVNVAHHGMTTFHHLYNPGGFTSVGSIKTKIGSISMNSMDGWKCRLAIGYKSDSQKFSFAIGPIQVFDARKEDDWKHEISDEDCWSNPVSVAVPEGAVFRPRSIPQLTNEEVLPAKLLSANENSVEEVYYNLSVTDTKSLNDITKRGDLIFVYSYLFSPKKQSVNFGCWWGEYFVNGKRVQVETDKTINFRQCGKMELNEGWNLFVFSVGVVKIHFDLHLALPQAADIIISATRSAISDVQFKVTDVIESKIGESALNKLDNENILNVDDLTELNNRWSNYVEPEIPGVNAKFLSWIRFGDNLGLSSDVVEDITVENESTLVFDMGGLNLGRIFIEYNAPENTKLSIGHSEEMFDNRPYFEKNTLISSVEGQICADGDGYMETFEPRGFRYLQLTISDNDGPVTIKKIGIKSQLYPYVKKGFFECSDSDFNKLYEWGYRTLRLCSEDVITDCSSRERTLYGGDLLPEAATAVVTTGDLGVVKHSMDVFLQSQDEEGWLQSSAPQPRNRTSLFDYPPLTLVNACWYCQLTNDIEFAERAYPVFHKMMAHAMELRDEQGLYSKGYQVFVAHGYKFKDGTVTAFNALMVRTFKAWATILELLGKDDEAKQSFVIAEKLNESLLKYLWNDELGFIDRIDEDGIPAQTSGVHANVWSELFADVDKDKWQKSFDVIQERMKSYNPYEEWNTVSTYNAFYYLGALYKAGEAKYAEDSIRTIYRMMLDNPTGTIWEHANSGKSLCHAWSTAPNFYFSTRILGVQLGLIEDTDLSKITIAPEAETITWARGAVMHPLGKVEVDWKLENDKLYLNYKAPEGAEVIVEPKGSLTNKELVVNC